MHDIYQVQLPEKMCPFGCKKELCPLGWDNVAKCPHNLDEKSMEELSEYLIKSFYYKDAGDDTESGEPRHSKMVPKEFTEAFLKWKRPGNVPTSKTRQEPKK